LKRRTIRRWGTPLAAFLLLGACTTFGTANDPQRAVAYVGDRVFDGVAVHDEAAVIVTGDVITGVGPADEVVPEGAEVVDLGDATILPGFIDLHVHLGINDLEDAVRGGVTSVRDLGRGTIVDVSGFDRALIPRYLQAGPLLSAPAGAAFEWHPRLAAAIRNPVQARRVASYWIGAGADVLKLYLGQDRKDTLPLPSVATARAVVEEAHAGGLQASAHVDNDEGVLLALRAGVDDLAHTACGLLERATVEQIVTSKTPVVSTLHVHADGCASQGNARRFVAAGGELLYGSDFSSHRGPRPGFSAFFGIDVRELQLMMSAGLSAQEVIAAATSGAGEYLGLAPLGSLVAGAPADVIAVRGDPLEDVSTLEEPILVVHGGHRVIEP